MLHRLSVDAQSINQSKALISVGQNVTDYSVRGKIKTVRISNSMISINVSEQLFNNKVAMGRVRVRTASGL